jgi:ABC-2 type transport system permease protein
VVDEDHGELATAFTGLRRSPDLGDVLTVRTLDDAASARRAVKDGIVDAAYVVPAGFTASAHGGAAVPVTVLASVDRTLQAQVAASVAESFVSQLNANRLSVATARAAGAPPGELAALGAATAELALPERTEASSTGFRPLSAISYYAPAMGLFFAFFAISFGARGFVLERRDGTLDRIAAAPLRPGVVLAGKALSTVVYVIASLTTMAVVTSLVFDADWGPAPAVAAIIVAMALAVMALTMLVIAVSRTESQADGIASIVIFGLVLLGGNFVSLAAAPELLRTLALATPNGWALRGFTDMATGATGSSTWLLPVVAILAFAALVGLAAAALGRRAVRR